MQLKSPTKHCCTSLYVDLPGEQIPSASRALCLQITSPVLASLLGPTQLQYKSKRILNNIHTNNNNIPRTNISQKILVQTYVKGIAN